MAKLEKNWNETLAKAISYIEKKGFTSRMISALECLVPFDYSVIFAYQGNACPIDLHDTFSKRRRAIYVGQYQEGPYLLDPFFQACRNNVAAGLYRMKDLAPDRFYQSEYYRSYYRKTELAEEISFILKVPNDVYITISLMRSQDKPAFSQKEMRKLKEVEPIILAIAEKHWVSVHNKFSNDGNGTQQILLQAQVDEAFKSFGKSVLTPRELEVVGLVLRGYSSDAIANILKIATGTVKTYRRSIYAKLGISSQSELFSMFITSLQK